MKNRAIVSDRGTITIPLDIRKLTNIYPGDLVEFESKNDRIILKHLIIKEPESDKLNNNDWNKLEVLAQKQLNKGQFTQYENYDKAKSHSRKLQKRAK